MPVKKNSTRGKKIIFHESLLQKKKHESTKEHHHRILEELKKFNVYNAFDAIFEMGKSKELPIAFRPIYGESINFYDFMNVGNLLTPKCYLFWLLGMFSFFESELIKLNMLRNEVNRLILLSKPIEALFKLNEIDELCKSWWSIKLRTHIYKEFNIEDPRDYLNNLSGNFPKHDVSNRIIELKLLNESNSISIYTKSFLGKLKEYRISGVQSAIDYGAFDSCKFLPINYDPSRKVKLETIYQDNYESLYDQYIQFKDVILEFTTFNKLDDNFLTRLKLFAVKVNDIELKGALYIDEGVINRDIMGVINDYTLGNYSVVIQKIDSWLLSGEVNTYALIEIYARSLIYVNSYDEPLTLFQKLSADLSSILKCDKKTYEKKDMLDRYSLKFKSESWAKSLNFHVTTALEEVNDENKIELARLQTRVLGEYNTYKAAVSNYDQNVAYEYLSDLPIYRKIKYKIHDGSTANITEEIIPIKSDYLKIVSHDLITKNMHIEAINFCINEYIKNNVSFLHLPITNLCKTALNLEKHDNNTYISCLVIYDIYSKEGNAIYDEVKSELFEEMMDENGSHKPSIIFNRSVYSQIERYFLKNICIPTQLDNFTAYESDDDVINERVAILDLLISSKSDDAEQLKKEKDSVLEKLFSDKLRAKIESGKLYVDVQALTSGRKHHYFNLYDQAKNLEGGVLLSHIENVETSNSADTFQLDGSALFASSRKMELLLTIYKSIVQDFTLNENYGLDKYLSAEIRHINFKTQLRACFEKGKLITSKRNEEYLPNEYWVNKYNFVNYKIVESLDYHLRNFSSKVDDILTDINAKFKVVVSTPRLDYVFDYIAYYHRLVKLSKIITISNNREEFLNLLLNLMWEITSENARYAQDLVSETLTREIFSAIDELEFNVNTARRDAAVFDLIQEIKNSRALFTNEVELVINWFRFVGGNDDHNYEKLNVVVDAAISSFESIYGHKYLKPKYLLGKESILLNYRESKSLFIAFFTSLENACKYGKPTEAVQVTLANVKDMTVIKIENEIHEITTKDVSELVLREKSKWNDYYSNLNTEEGGSGLYKIYSILKNASTGFSFDIKSKENKFISSIEIHHGNFDCRR